MAGVPAGRLSIEIVAEIARLQADLDKAKRAVSAASRDIAASAKAANDNLAGIGRGATAWGGAARNVTASAGQMRAGMQQLGYQLGDVAQQFAMGIKPQVIFAQQSGQVIQALSLMTNSTKGFLGFLAGPWGAIIGAATVVLVPLISRLLDTSEAAKKVEWASYALKDAQGILGSVIDLTTGKISTQSEALWGLARAQAAAGRIASIREQADARSALNGLDNNKLTVDAGFGGGLSVGVSKSQSAVRDIISAFKDGSLNPSEAVKGLESFVKTGIIAENTFLEVADAITRLGVAAENEKVFTDLEKGLNGDTAAMGQFLKLKKEHASAAEKLAERLAREAAATEALISGLYKVADAYRISASAGKEAEIAAQATEKGMRKQADVDAYVAQQKRKFVAEQVADLAQAATALRDQNDAQQIVNNQVRQGITTTQEAQDWMQREQQLRPFNIALALAEGDAKKKLKEDIARLSDEIDRNNQLNRESEDAKRVEQAKRDMKLLEGELELTKALGDQRLKALRGLSGDRLEDELARINLEHEKATIWLRAQAQAAEYTAQGLHGMAAAALDAAKAQMKMADVNFEYEKAEVSIGRVNDQLSDMIDNLQNIGGFAGVLGGVLGVLTGGRVNGHIGDLLNVGVADPITKEVRKLGDVFKDSLGQFGGKLAGFLKNAGVGVMGATAILGKQGTTNMIGAAAGGILGSIGGSALSGTITAAATSALGSTLGAAIGSAVPVIGTILGGVAGSLLGGLFGGGTKKGSAIISGGGISGYTGNKGDLKDQAGQIAGGLLDTLQQIATQFGTTLDSAAMGRLSVGIRNGKYVVDTTGQGNTKGSGVQSFGKDAEAAANFAIKTMLDRGAIAMREGSLKIIKSATDLQTGLAKALQFEEIMDMLEGGSSQLVQQVKALRAQFDGMIEAMKEAGASVADLTRAQQLQQQQIDAMISAAGSNYRSTFYTDSQNTAFAKQQIHAVLDPLGKGAIDTVQEYMAAVEAAQKDTSDAGLAWLDTLYSLTDAFGTLKAAGDAAAAARQAEAAQKAADAAQAKANAENALRQAYERESGVLQQTIDKFNGFADTLADFRKELLAGDDATASYAARLAELRRVGGLAGMGDATALGDLPGVGRDFLTAAKNQATSAIEYQRAVALVARYTVTAEQASRGMATEAQKQLDAINKQVGALIDLTDGVLSLTEALKQFGGGGGSPSTSPDPVEHEHRTRGFARLFEIFQPVFAPQPPSQNDNGTEQALNGFSARLEAVERNTGEMSAFWRRLSPDGLSIRIATDGVPIEVAS